MRKKLRAVKRGIRNDIIHPLPYKKELSGYHFLPLPYKK